MAYLFSVTSAGLPFHKISHSHPDMDGKWGGHKTWVVHYESEFPMGKEYRELYRHVGNLDELTRDRCYPFRHSRWSLVERTISLSGDYFPLVDTIKLFVSILAYKWERFVERNIHVL